jgi:hypothetical protein
MASIKKYYVDSKLLEEHWTKWLDNHNEESWKHLLDGIYKICYGVAIHFHPHDEDEHHEFAHEAFVLTIAKISDGRLKFTPGRAPVFNLLTTTVFRHLYSKMNKESRRKVVLANLKKRLVGDHTVEVNEN